MVKEYHPISIGYQSSRQRNGANMSFIQSFPGSKNIDACPRRATSGHKRSGRQCGRRICALWGAAAPRWRKCALKCAQRCATLHVRVQAGDTGVYRSTTTHVVGTCRAAGRAKTASQRTPENMDKMLNEELIPASTRAIRARSTIADAHVWRKCARNYASIQNCSRTTVEIIFKSQLIGGSLQQ